MISSPLCGCGQKAVQHHVFKSIKESTKRIHSDSYSGTEARASTSSYESSIVKEEVMYMRCRL